MIEHPRRKEGRKEGKKEGREGGREEGWTLAIYPASYTKIN